MKGMFLVFGELVLALSVASLLPVATIWQVCGLLMAVMAVPAGFAICTKRGADLLALAVVYAGVSAVGGFFAPDGWHLLLWWTGLISAATFLVAGLIQVFGNDAAPANHSHIRETADEDGIMYTRRQA